MLTIRAEIKRSEQKVDYSFNVKLRFTLNRQVKRMSTSLFVMPDDLTRSGEFKKNTPIYKEIIALEQEYRLKCAKMQVDLHNYSLEQLFSILRFEDQKKKGVDYISFSRNWISTSSLKSKGDYTTALNSFISYLGKDDIDIREITLSTIQGYQNYLNEKRVERTANLEKEGKRIPSYRCHSLYLTLLKRLFNEAMNQYNRSDEGLILITKNPFDSITIPKQEATRKRALSKEFIIKLQNLPYQKTNKGIHHTNRYNLAKDMFILSFCLIGMNSADLYKITEITGDTLIYKRAKTTDRRLDEALMKVNVPDMVKPLIEKYRDKTGKRLFNFYQNYSDRKAFNKAINKGLKQIGEELGIDDLEFYAARHSWATIAINKCKIDKYTVHAALNHVDASMRVTDIYIDRDFVIENEANKKVLKYVFG